MHDVTTAEERWKAIPGYVGQYEVSDRGRVRSLWVRNGTVDRPRQVPKILCPSQNWKGYEQVALCSRPAVKQSTRKVHQLVLDAFVGPRPAGLVCRHLNGVLADNRLVNLRWGTHSENNGRDKARHGTLLLGEKNPNAKLSVGQVQSIRGLAHSRVPQRAIAKMFGVAHSTVKRIVARKMWGHLSTQEVA